MLGMQYLPEWVAQSSTGSAGTKCLQMGARVHSAGADEWWHSAYRNLDVARRSHANSASSIFTAPRMISIPGRCQLLIGLEYMQDSRSLQQRWLPAGRRRRSDFGRPFGVCHALAFSKSTYRSKMESLPSWAPLFCNYSSFYSGPKPIPATPGALTQRHLTETGTGTGTSAHYCSPCSTSTVLNRHRLLVYEVAYPRAHWTEELRYYNQVTTDIWPHSLDQIFLNFVPPAIRPCIRGGGSAFLKRQAARSLTYPTNWILVSVLRHADGYYLSPHTLVLDYPGILYHP